jgi:hypothetical protein
MGSHPKFQNHLGNIGHGNFILYQPEPQIDVFVTASGSGMKQIAFVWIL